MIRRFNDYWSGITCSPHCAAGNRSLHIHQNQASGRPIGLKFRFEPCSAAIIGHTWHCAVDTVQAKTIIVNPCDCFQTVSRVIHGWIMVHHSLNHDLITRRQSMIGGRDDDRTVV